MEAFRGNEGDPREQRETEITRKRERAREKRNRNRVGKEGRRKSASESTFISPTGRADGVLMGCSKTVRNNLRPPVALRATRVGETETGSVGARKKGGRVIHAR